MGAISHVLAGISPGLNRNHKVDMGEALGSYYEVASDLGVGETMDNLFAAAHSGDLGQSAVLVSTGLTDADKYGYIGPVQTDASYAELTGDIEGYLLGSNLSTSTVQELWGARDLFDGLNTLAKLSTCLHNYYVIPRSDQTPTELHYSKRYQNFVNSTDGGRIKSGNIMEVVKKEARNFAACYIYVKAKDSGGIDKFLEGGKALFNFEAENEHVDNAFNAFEKFVNVELSIEKAAG